VPLLLDSLRIRQIHQTRGKNIARGDRRRKIPRRHLYPKRLERSVRRLMYHRYRRVIPNDSRVSTILDWISPARQNRFVDYRTASRRLVNYVCEIKLQLERTLGSLLLFVFLHAVNEIRANGKFPDLINAYRRYVMVAFGSWSDSFESARTCGKYRNPEYTQLDAYTHGVNRPSCIPFPRHALSSGAANSVYQLTWMRSVLLI